MSTCNKSLL